MTSRRSTQFNLKLLTLNVRGLRNNNKRKRVFTWLKKLNYDVICLQETHSSEYTEHIWKSQWPQMAMFFSHGEKNAKGTAILLNKQYYNEHTCTVVDEMQQSHKIRKEDFAGLT